MKSIFGLILVFVVMVVGTEAASKRQAVEVPVYRVVDVTNVVRSTEAIMENGTNLVNVIKEDIVVTRSEFLGNDVNGIPMFRSDSRVVGRVIRDDTQQPLPMPAVRANWPPPAQYQPPPVPQVIVQPVYVERGRKPYGHYARSPSRRAYTRYSRHSSFYWVGVDGTFRSGLYQRNYSNRR